jgi:drug/metabolite transporter (DMT)-like permease
MTYLILSVLSSTIILIIFKLFRKYDVDTFQAIVFNYLIAFTVGFSLYGGDWSSTLFKSGNWMPFATIIGILFISLFLLMGRSAQDNGIGTTSVAVKMGLVIPVIAAILLYNEALGWMKVLGVIAALSGVVLITYQPQSNRISKKGNAWMLIILFVGSGLLDTLLNYVEKKALGDLSPALFSAIGFGIAAVIGSAVLIVKLIRKQTTLAFRNIIGGVVLGVPNYFSIYFLIMAIRDEMDDSVTYAVNNVGIVLLSFLLGIFLFRESLTWLKGIGVALAVLAIVMLMF